MYNRKRIGSSVCLWSGTWSMCGRILRALEAPTRLLQPGFCGWFVNKAFMWLVRLTRLSASWGSGFYFCFSALPFNLLSNRFFFFTHLLGTALDSLSTSLFYAIVCLPSCTSLSFGVFWSEIVIASIVQTSNVKTLCLVYVSIAAALLEPKHTAPNLCGQHKNY